MKGPSQPQASLPDFSTSELVQHYLRQCQNRGLSKETVRSYKSYLHRFAEVYPRLPASPEPIEAFIGSYICGDERRHGCFRTLRAFYNAISVRNNINNPMVYVLPPRRSHKEKPALTMDELKILLEYPDHPPKIRTVLYLLADTGARIGEVYNLTSNDIFDTSVRLSGKTGQRIVPVSPKVIELLRGLGPGRLFSNGLSYFKLRRQVSAAFKAAGLHGGGSHLLRHTFCTLWRGSDSALKTITGHKSWVMIDNYSHRKLEKATEEHQVNSPLAKLYHDDSSKKLSNPAFTMQTISSPIDKETGLPMRQLIHIIPGAGWKAVFGLEPESYDPSGRAIPNIFRKPLVCFALVRHPDGMTDIRGFDGCDFIFDVDDVGNFLGYESPGENEDFSDHWVEWIIQQPNYHEIKVCDLTLKRN